MFLGFDVVSTRMKSSIMVVVCLSETLMKKISPANLGLERFSLESCSTSLAPWLLLFHLSFDGLT